jgi:tetratricopeptide (TPR) repeat protein
MVDFEEVYSWLNHFEEGNYLSVPVDRLITHMKEAIADSNNLLVRHHINILQPVNEMINIRSPKAAIEKAEIHVECGRAFFLLGDLTEALNEFRKSVSIYKCQHPHNTAVTNWMLGCVLWERAKVSEAISIWKRSFDQFGNIGRNSVHHDWYEDKISGLQNALNDAIDKARIPFDQGIVNESDTLS